MSNIVLHPLNSKTPYRCDAEQPVLTSELLAKTIRRGAQQRSPNRNSPLRQAELGEQENEQISHDARCCPACLRAGTHTIVTSVEQLAAFVVSGDAVSSPGSPRLEPDSTVVAIALESKADNNQFDNDREGQEEKEQNHLRPLRWTLFIDRSADVVFSSAAEQRSQFLTLAGGDPLPPLRSVVPGFAFSADCIEDAHSVVLCPVVSSFNQFALLPGGGGGGGNGGGGGGTGEEEEESRNNALLAIAARALADLADLAALHGCSRALHLLAGQVLCCGGVYFYVDQTIPAGAMVRVGDETQIAIGAPLIRSDIAGWGEPLFASPVAAMKRTPQQKLKNPTTSSAATTGTSPLSDASTGTIVSPQSPPSVSKHVHFQQEQQQQQQQAHHLQDAATSPIVVIRPPPKAIPVPENNDDVTDDDILSAPSLSPSLDRTSSPPQLQPQKKRSGVNNEEVIIDTRAESWVSRFAHLNRIWQTKFPSGQRPVDLLNEIAALASACIDLQVANNNAVAFLNRMNAAGSRLMNSIPLPASITSTVTSSSMSSSSSSIKPQSSTFHKQDEVVMVMFPDADQVSLALELAGVRVAECWATPGGSCSSSNIATKRKKRKNHQKRKNFDGENRNSDFDDLFEEDQEEDEKEEHFGADDGEDNDEDDLAAPVLSLEETILLQQQDERQISWGSRCCYAAVTPASRPALEPLLAAGTVVVLGEPRRVTRLSHSVLDDLHRMLEYHYETVQQQARQLLSPARVDWNFIMGTWGSQLALLVRDVRAEMNAVAEAAQVSNAAFHEVEAALEEYRMSHAQQAERLTQHSFEESQATRRRNQQEGALFVHDRITRGNDERAAASYQKQHLSEVLKALTNAVAHEMAGEEDLAAQQGVLNLWPQFELLGRAYELVLFKVRSAMLMTLTVRDDENGKGSTSSSDGFLDKLLVSRLEPGEATNTSIRSLYQGAVNASRQVSELPARERILSVRGGNIDGNLRERARERMTALVHAASDMDVFAGLPVIESYVSDVRSFQEFLVLLSRS